MDISQIKSAINVSSLDFVRAMDKDGKPTKFAKVWDNDNRRSIIVHDDHLKALPTSDKLEFREQDKTGPKGDYTLVTIWETSGDKEIILSV